MFLVLLMLIVTEKAVLLSVEPLLHLGLILDWVIKLSVIDL